MPPDRLAGEMSRDACTTRRPGAGPTTISTGGPGRCSARQLYLFGSEPGRLPAQLYDVLVRTTVVAGLSDALSAISDTDEGDIFGAALYTPGETDGLPEEAVLASLGCGNPLAVAELGDGERVLDLGSGGGIDVLCCPLVGSGRPGSPTAWT
jgi:hypothetical protein